MLYDYLVDALLPRAKQKYLPLARDSQCEWQQKESKHQNSYVKQIHSQSELWVYYGYLN